LRVSESENRAYKQLLNQHCLSARFSDSSGAGRKAGGGGVGSFQRHSERCWLDVASGDFYTRFLARSTDRALQTACSRSLPLRARCACEFAWRECSMLVVCWRTQSEFHRESRTTDPPAWQSRRVFFWTERVRPPTPKAPARPRRSWKRRRGPTRS